MSLLTERDFIEFMQDASGLGPAKPAAPKAVRTSKERTTLALLVGRKVSSFSLTAEVITFETDAGPLRYRADGDCCSRSWFEGADAPDAIIGEVLVVDEVDGTEVWTDTDGNEVDQLARNADELRRTYFYRVFTARGCCTIDMRNSSNGYYGGSVELIEDAEVRR